MQDPAELVVGEAPTRVEHLWQMMVRQHFWHGHGIERATAADDANWFADLARQAAANGFTAFKSMAVPPTMPREGGRPPCHSWHRALASSVPAQRRRC